MLSKGSIEEPFTEVLINFPNVRSYNSNYYLKEHNNSNIFFLCESEEPLLISGFEKKEKILELYDILIDKNLDTKTYYFIKDNITYYVLLVKINELILEKYFKTIPNN